VAANDALIIGVLSVELSLPEAMTLKDKRRILKSMKDRLANDYNISIAEVGDNDVIGRAVLGIAMVGNDGRFLESMLSKIVDHIRRIPQAVLVDYSIERLY